MKDMQDTHGPSKVVVIGLDGATFDIINPLITQARLPNLQHIIERGAKANLKSTFPPLSPVAWSSFITGSNPGKHGIFDFFGHRPGSYHFQINNSTFRKTQSMWDIASRKGKIVGVVNVPMTYPVEEVNGFMISGLGTPSIKTNFTHPPDLYQEIVKEIGRYILNPDYITSSNPSNPRYLKGMIDMMDNHLKTITYLMQAKAWDLFVYVSTATDEIQHDCWKYMDQSHPKFSEESNNEFADYIFQIYEKIDNLLGEVLNLIDPYTTILVMSDHGQGPLHRNFSLNTWLRREGYLSINSKYQKNMEYRLTELLRKFSDSWLLPLGMNTRNESIQKLMSKIRGIIIGLSSSNYLKTIDWYKTTAFCEGSFPAVYINVEGKFPMGRVRPDEAYEKLRDEIASKLEVLKDPQTGERIVEKIYKPEEIYHGEQIQNAPDLVCMLRDGYHGGGELEMLYFGLQDNDLFGNHRWSGQHRINGILIAAGPNIIPGKTMTGARIIDLAPTILYLLGLPIPKSMDGRVLEDIFRKDYLSTHEIRFFEEKFPERLEGNGRPFSNEESELLKERLRGLGYIE